MRRVILGILTGVVVLVLFIVLCTFVKRPYEKVLLVRFGSPIEEKDQARICYNWFLKFPTDSVVRFDQRLHLYTGPLQEMPTAGKELISVRTFAAWRIVDPVKFYRTTGGSDEKAQSTLEQIILGKVPGKFATRQLDELFNSDQTKIHADEIARQVASEATESSLNADGTVKSVGLRDMGIQVVDIGFSRMAFAPSNAENVYKRMVAELNKRATDFQAQGLADANTIRAEGIRVASEEKSKAIAQAQNIRGQGDAAALSILASVQQTEQSREFYQYWKSLDFLKTSLAKNTVLVLSSDSDILAPLLHRPGAVTPATLPGQALKIVPAATAPGR